MGDLNLFDSLDRMHSATTAAQTCEEMTVLVSTPYWEQVCKIKTSLEQRSKASAGDCTALFRGLLLRNLFLPVCPPDLSPVE